MTGSMRIYQILFRRLSGRRASREFGALVASGGAGVVVSVPNSNGGVPSSRSFQTLSRSISSNETLYASTPCPVPFSSLYASGPASPPSRLFSRSDSSCSSGSSPSSSVPNSPATGAQFSLLHNRPSSLHVLKHKLKDTLKSPRSRNKSVTMPLSPLARTDSQHSQANNSCSPARSPSPLAAGCFNTPVCRNLGGSSINKKTITKPRKSDPSASPLLGITTTTTTVANNSSSGQNGLSSRDSSPARRLKKGKSPDRAAKDSTVQSDQSGYRPIANTNELPLANSVVDESLGNRSTTSSSSG